MITAEVQLSEKAVSYTHLVLTGIRRSGKSVMLNLIQEELAQNGVQPEQFISLNFENMSLSLIHI